MTEDEMARWLKERAERHLDRFIWDSILGSGHDAIEGVVLSRETVDNEKGRARVPRLAPAPQEERDSHGTE
jgi:hypothetical protein